MKTYLEIALASAHPENLVPAWGEWITKRYAERLGLSTEGKGDATVKLEVITEIFRLQALAIKSIESPQ